MTVFVWHLLFKRQEIFYPHDKFYANITLPADYFEIGVRISYHYFRRSMQPFYHSIFIVEVLANCRSTVTQIG